MTISSRRTPLVDDIDEYDSNGGADYDDFAVWEAATDIDLATATTGKSLKIRLGNHNDQMVAGGATTNANYFRRIFGDPPTIGTRDAGATIVSTVASSLCVITENYFSVQDLYVSGSMNNAGNYYGLDMQGTFNDIVGCYLHQFSNTGAGAYRPIVNRAGDNRIINTIIEACEGDSTTGDVYNIQASGTPLLISNVTIFGTGSRGINATVANLTQCINVLIDGPTTCFVGTYTSSGSKNNASSDSTAPGANSVTTANPVYVDEGANNYHIDPTDAVVQGVGFDQSSVYTDDIDNDGDISTWNIGADSFASGGPAIITAPASILWAEKGTNLAISTVSAVDSDDDLSTVRLQVTGTGCTMTITVGDTTITAGSNGSNDLTIGSATEAQINTALATMVFNSGTFRGESTLTITATDALSNVSTATIRLFVDVTNLTLQGSNADLLLVLATLQAKLLTGDSTDTVSWVTTDSGALTDTDNIVLNLVGNVVSLEVSPLSIKASSSVSETLTITLIDGVLIDISDAISIAAGLTLGGAFVGLSFDQVTKLNSRQFSIRLYGNLTSSSVFGSIELDESEVELI